MLITKKNKIHNFVEKLSKNSTVMAIIFAVSYLSLEPVLTQLVAIRAYSIVYYPYLIIRYASIALILLSYIALIIIDRNYIKKGIIIPILIMFVCYIIPAFKYNCEVSVYLETMIPLLAYYILLIYIFKFPNSMKLFVSLVSWVYLALMCINIFFKLYPDLYGILGIWETESFISSIENLTGFPLVMGLFFTVLDDYYSKSTVTKIKLIIYVAVYLVSTYILWVVAQLLGACVLILYFILPPIRKLLDKLSLSAWLFLFLALFVIIVWFWEPIMNISAVKFLLETVLKKDVTFSGRLNIWNAISEMVAESPIIGHGLMDNPQNMYFDPNWNQHYVHAHNTFLQTLYEGGIVTLLSFCILVIFSSKRISKICHNTKLAGYIKITAAVYFINLEMDQFFIFPWRSCLWCIICFLCNMGVLVSENDN